jgi:hypothetical protein
MFFFILFIFFFLRFQSDCVSACPQNYENISDTCVAIECNNRDAVNDSCSLLEDDNAVPDPIVCYIKADGSCNDQCDGVAVFFFFFMILFLLLFKTTVKPFTCEVWQILYCIFFFFCRLLWIFVVEKLRILDVVVIV